MKRVLLVGVMSLMGVVGCVKSANPPGGEGRLQAAQEQAFAVSPQVLAQKVKQVLAEPRVDIPIEREAPGVIETGFKAGYQGDWHITRYWQERTRYRITIVPDFNDPTGHSRLLVQDYSEERSNDRGTWTANPAIHRPDRVAELIGKIRQAVAQP